MRLFVDCGIPRGSMSSTPLHESLPAPAPSPVPMSISVFFSPPSYGSLLCRVLSVAQATLVCQIPGFV